jgi:hypothetical protein
MLHGPRFPGRSVGTDRERFELSIPRKRYAGFRDRCLQPLGHLSSRAEKPSQAKIHGQRGQAPILAQPEALHVAPNGEPVAAARRPVTSTSDQPSAELPVPSSPLPVRRSGCLTALPGTRRDTPLCFPDDAPSPVVRSAAGARPRGPVRHRRARTCATQRPRDGAAQSPPFA